MTEKKTKFQAALIKVKIGKSYVWYWANPNTQSQISPEFFTQDAAEKWFDDIMYIHEETYDLIERSKKGEFYTVRGLVDMDKLFMNRKIEECPYLMYMTEEILEIIVLALNENDAKRRVENYIDDIQWIDL